MGLMVDTSVFIHLEKAGPIDTSQWNAGESLFISVVTASELLMGVHRADSEARRSRRAAFVEAILAEVGILDFTLPAARLHAELGASMARIGKPIGAHDLIIAATAKYHDFALLTKNVDEFSRISGLRVVPFA